jgi:hypothetical protein
MGMLPVLTGKANSMKKISLALALLFIIAFVMVDQAGAFRCGSHLVHVGDRKWDVLRKCGPPDFSEAREEKRMERVYGAPYGDWDSSIQTRIPFGAVVYVLIEEWVYNSGPTKFVRILHFENSRLVEITTGDYGF